MEAVEIVVYLFVALVIGMLLLQFLTSWSVTDTFKGLHSLIRGERQPTYAEVDKDQFVMDAIHFWESCGMGEVDKTLALHVKDSGELNRTFLFEKIKQLSLCNTMQSSSEGCGNRENVIMNTITLPRIIRMECNSTNEVLIITG